MKGLLGSGVSALSGDIVSRRASTASAQNPNLTIIFIPLLMVAKLQSCPRRLNALKAEIVTIRVTLAGCALLLSSTRASSFLSRDLVVDRLSVREY